MELNLPDPLDSSEELTCWNPSTNDAYTLEDAFRRFKNDRRKLQDIYYNTTCKFRQIQTELGNTSFANEVKTRLLFDTEKIAVERVILQDPCINVVGQTKSGKSSLINEILGRTVVTADQRPCTARLIELYHGEVEKPVVREKNRSGEVIKTTICAHDSIPAKLINLNNEEREDIDRVGVTISVEVNNDFLKSGVRIIDSPGRNENPVLDEMLAEHLKTVLPFVVYVIDGKNLLTMEDITDINVIRKHIPGHNIFFVVQKIDPSAEETYDSDGGEESEEEWKTDEEKEYIVKEKIFNKLVKNDFIPEGENMQTCVTFHALSAWKTKKYRRMITRGELPDKHLKHYVNDLQRFKQCLLDSAKSHLVVLVQNAAQTLRDVHVRCLDVFIDAANRLVKEQDKTELLIEHIEGEESKLFSSLLEMVRANASMFPVHLAKIFEKGNKEKLLGQVKDLQYSDFLGEEENGPVITQCQNQIKDWVVSKLNQQIYDIIIKEYGAKDGILQQLAKEVKKVENHGDVQVATTLQNLLVKSYKFDTKGMTFKLSVWNKVIFYMRGFLLNLSMALKSCVVSDKTNSEGWKKFTAEEHLAGVNIKQLSDAVLKGMEDHIEDGHSGFLEEIGTLKELWQCSFKMNEEERKKIHDVAPVIARLELSCSELIEERHYGNINFNELLGSGAQGSVYPMNGRGPQGEECAVKIIYCHRRTGSQKDPLNDLAMEIHYSRQFKHPHVMKVFSGFVVKAGSRGPALHIVSERMVDDLQNMLPKIPCLKKRLELALEVAHALKYLQDKDMIHRDVKCSNILVDKNNHIKLADFGLCKPAGMANDSVVGTPVHIAPEIITRKGYNKSVDIYSFGMVLWYICEGHGSHPKYTLDDGVGWVVAYGDHEKRPERKGWFRHDCWNLMELCWHASPEKRPTVEGIINELEQILRRMSEEVA